MRATSGVKAAPGVAFAPAARALAVLALATLARALIPAAALASSGLRVRGNRLVDGPGRGHVVQLRGVNRSGLEYACIQGVGLPLHQLIAAQHNYGALSPCDAGCRSQVPVDPAPLSGPVRRARRD
jgi:hypothetical protein